MKSAPRSTCSSKPSTSILRNCTGCSPRSSSSSANVVTDTRRSVALQPAATWRSAIYVTSVERPVSPNSYNVADPGASPSATSSVTSRGRSVRSFSVYDGLGLHIDAAPAAIIERPCNRQLGRVMSPHVDVKAVLHVVEGTPLENILAGLRI